MTQMTLTDYAGFIQPDGKGRHRLYLAVEGMHCAGCAFKIEKTLNANQNVEARVNVTDRRLTLVWSGAPALGNALVQKAEALGFHFAPVKEKAAADNAQEKFLLRCMAVAGFSAGNLMVFSLALWFSSRDSMGGTTRDLMFWYSALLGLPTVIYAGQPFFRSAFQALVKRRTNMDVPISVAVILTTAMSLFETLRGGEHVYFDGAVMLLFLLLVGRYLDARARARTRSAAADLLSLMSGEANIIDGSGLRRLPAADLVPGMVLRVAKGEKILADGVSSMPAVVDAAALTGETLPQNISAGKPLLAGMVNLGAPLDVRVEKPQGVSLMSDIITLMQKAEQGNAAYVRLADRLACWYTPVVHLLALATFLGWFYAGGLAWQEALMRAVTVLIVTCPCALGLAVPVAQVVAGRRLFRRGLLIKTADALERLAAVDTVMLDKTGTLTTGKIVFENRKDFSLQELNLLAALSAQSRHPLAQAVAGDAADITLTQVEEIEGKGIAAVYAGKPLRLGSAAFAGAISEDDNRLELWFTQGDSAPKRIILSDTLHTDAAETIAALKKDYRVLLLSGDRPAVVAGVAAAAGIDAWHAGIDPREKFSLIEKASAEGRRVLMVGDGLNDAAALSRAFSSMSPSSALDIAQNAADIVYQQKGVGSILDALQIARQTQRIVRQNLALSLGYNLIAVPLAMAGLATPLIAAVAMSLSSLTVIANALRLKGREA